MDKTLTTCKKCNRVIYVADVDDKGRCEDCQPETKPAPELEGGKKA